MKLFNNEFNSICSWFSWRRVIELITAFLLVRIVFSSLHPSFEPTETIYTLLVYLGGVISGIGLVLSTGRRATDCQHRWARFKKLIKDCYSGSI